MKHLMRLESFTESETESFTESETSVHPASKPQVRDYVICRAFFNNEYLNIFLFENIGQIIRIDDISRYQYIVKYNISKDLTEDLRTFFDNAGHRYFQENEIVHFSKNKEDCEAYLAALKYNL